MMTSKHSIPIVAIFISIGCGGQSSPEMGASTAAPLTASKTSPSSDETSSRSGSLHVTKSCLDYTGLAGSFCTITTSNLKEIAIGSRVVYASAAGAASLDSDLVLYSQRHRRDTAFGHVKLDFSTGLGDVTFSGGTGRFIGFSASVVVKHLDGPNWSWDGTYRFSDNEEGDE